jgi:predicted RNase H-like HicB family nuclease
MSSEFKQMKFTFTIFVEPDGDEYHAYCPSFKGLHSSGKTQEEACENAAQAAVAYLESLIKHNDPIPLDVTVTSHIPRDVIRCQRTDMVQVAFA